MNKYIVIAYDGYTTDNDGEETSNAQVLGRVMADSKAEAIQKVFASVYGCFDISEAAAIQLHESEWA